MATKKRGKHYTPIGIDIKDSAVYAVQYQVAKGQPKLHAAATHRIGRTEGSEDRSAATVAALRAVMKSAPFVGRRVIGVVPRADVEMRMLKLSAGITPDDGPEFTEDLVRKARRSLLYPPEEAVLDYLPLGDEAEEGKHFFSVLLIASKRESIDRHLELFKAAGLQCMSLDVAPCAMARALRDGDGTFSLIEFDMNNTVIAVAQGENLLFSRTLKIGMQEVIDRMAAAMDMPHGAAENLLRSYGINHTAATRCDLRRVEEEGSVDAEVIPASVYEAASAIFETLAKELRRSIDYVSHQNHAIFGRGPWMGGPVETVALLGDPILPRMEDFLADRLDVPVEVRSPFAKVTANGWPIPAAETAFVVASGLALRGETQ